MVSFIYYLRVCTLAHSCLIKVQSIFSNRRRLFFTRCSSSKKSADHIDLLFCFTQLPSDMFAGKFVSHFLFVADDIIRRGLVRSCPCDLALFCKQLFCACVWWLNTGILIICCVCSCPGVLAGTWGWCDFLFPISIDLCVFSVLCVHARAC